MCCVVLALGLPACDRPAHKPIPQSAGSSSKGEPDAIYSVRGRVESVPIAGKPTSEFVVHHEPIDSFHNPDGTLGMSSMTMPFPLSKGLSINDLRVGDVVEMTFAVWTKPGNLGWEARAVKRLPSETQLRFGKAAPPLTPADTSQH